MRGAILLSILIISLPALGLNCFGKFIFISGISQTDFERDIQRTRAAGINRAAWLTTEIEPKILLGFDSDRDDAIKTAVAKNIVCCGISEAETLEILGDLSVKYPEGQIPLHSYLEIAFERAAAKFGRECHRDCMLTALTHIHYAFADLEKPAKNHEAISHFMEPVADRTRLEWGDVWVLRNEQGKVVHVTVNLANGLVLHKPGIGQATVVPLTTAMDIYSRDVNPEQLEVWRKKSDAPESLKATFAPAPQRSRSWLAWLPSFLWGVY